MAAYSTPGFTRRTRGQPERAHGARASLERILERVRTQPSDPYGQDGPVHGCARCADTGLAEYVTGTFTTPGGQHLKASELRPVFRPCPVCAGAHRGVRS